MKKIIIALCAILALTGSAFAETTAATEAPAETAVEQTAELDKAEEMANELRNALKDTMDEGYAEEAADYSDVIQVVYGKVKLWDSTDYEAEEGTDALPPVKVTLETKTPVVLVNFDSPEGYFGMVARDGIAPAFISITPAHMGEHYNLNDYTVDMLMNYIKGVVDGSFDEDNYTSEILQSEGGNTYVAISDDTTRSISTIYDDFVMEIYQFNSDKEGKIIPLTDADKAFALEIFQGIWTE